MYVGGFGGSRVHEGIKTLRDELGAGEAQKRRDFGREEREREPSEEGSLLHRDLESIRLI